MASVELIPLRKSLLIMIAVLFCGAIFASSSSILVSLNNFNEYVYGSEENVVIIYDRAAQTPFTSRVPASYDLILNQIPGVEITSPELMIPGVIKDQTALMRGVNITSFSEISTFSLRGDSDLRTEDRASVWIGANLANRLDVEIGDVVFFQGSLLNNGVTMKIIGVLSGSEQIEDEIIAPLALAEKLSRRLDEYNHIKVRYNPEITNQGEILALTTSFYETKISLMRNNGTERWGNITLQIFDKSGDQLLIQERKTVFLIDLPFGEYTFVFSENQTVVHQESRFVSKSGDYEFILNDLSYRVYLSPIIQEKSGSIAFELIQQGTTLSSGYVDGETIERTLEVGNYEIVYISPIGSVTHSFAVSEASEHRHNLSKISYQPSILGLTNGSILSQNGILFINNTVSGDGLRVFIDDILYSTSSELLNYSLTPGEHSIVLKNSREIILRSYSVTINSTIGSSDQDHESIQINEYDPNYNLTSEYVGKTVLLSNQGKRVLVTVGEITSISTDVDAITIDGTQFVPDQDITLVKEIQTERLSITIINDLGLLTGDIHISHIILLNTSNPVNIGERWEVSEFPVGPIQILIERIGGVNRLFDFNFVPNEAIKIILEPTGEVQLYKYLALRTDISADLATEFFNQELTGPFALFTIARLTESIIVVFLLLVNLSGIYSGIASEYRKELSTLRAMGYSDHQRTLSLIRGSLKFSIPTLLAGTAIGLLIAHALLITDGTVLFGHRFVPSLPIQFWILNIVIGHFLMYFGAYIGLKLEDRF